MSTVKKRYGLIGVVGDREDGKTTWAVRHMKMELNLPMEDRQYVKGYSNLHYKNSPEIEFTNYAGIKLLDRANERGVPDSVIHLDQIHKYADSMSFATQESKEFIDTLIESRQHGFDLVCTTWSFKAFHPRLRKFIKLWVSASQKTDGFHYDYFDVDAGKIITPPDGLVLRFDQAKSVWPFFSTGELVRDDTLSRIAHVKNEDRMGLAKELAVYEPCG